MYNCCIKFTFKFTNFFIIINKGGVNNLHGMPGLISGIGSSIVAALATRDSFQVDGDKNR